MALHVGREIASDAAAFATSLDSREQSSDQATGSLITAKRDFPPGAKA
jgi:hypothetical protein